MSNPRAILAIAPFLCIVAVFACDTPAEVFWSLTLYGTATRSMIQAPSNDSAARRSTSQEQRGRFH